MAQICCRKNPTSPSREKLARNSSLTLKKVPLESLSLHNRALRRHPEPQIAKLMSSFVTFGLIAPMIVDADGKIIAGELRLEVARRLKLVEVPVIIADHLTPDEARAYRIADNKLAEGATWDIDALRDEVAKALTFEIDPEALGFGGPELDVLLATPEAIAEAEEDVAPRPDPIVRLADIFDVSTHALMCGNSTDPEQVAALMSGELADMALTDAPYNSPISNFVSTRTGSRAHREFVQASGEMSDEEFSVFLKTVMVILRDSCRDGAVIEVFMDHRNIHRLIAAGEDCGLNYFNLAVYVKNTAGMGSFLRSQHELVAIFAKPGASVLNNIMLGANGRFRTNCWMYEGRAGFSRGRKEELDRHPTPKPVPMFVDAILDCTKRNDIVLDLFVGGGTTLIAAERIGRRARVMELDPGYAEASLIRYRTAFGVEPIHRQTGLTLSELERQRREEGDAQTVSQGHLLALPPPGPPTAPSVSGIGE